MDQKKFYITTPIYYPSDKLQHALASVVFIVNGLFTQTHSKSSSRYYTLLWGRFAPNTHIIRIKRNLRKCF